MKTALSIIRFMKLSIVKAPTSVLEKAFDLRRYAVTYAAPYMYILTEKWAGLSFKNGPPERAYKVNKIMRRCHCSDLVFNHLLSLFEPV